MLKKKVKFEDFNGNEQEVEIHFNLTKTELSNFYAQFEGGFDQYFAEAVRRGDLESVTMLRLNFIHMSYGQKSPDGLRFGKTEEDLFNFKQSAAYDEVCSSVMKDVDTFLDFVYAIVPSKVGAEAKKETEKVRARLAKEAEEAAKELEPSEATE